MSAPLIVVAHDDVAVCAAVRALLRDAGYRVITATSDTDVYASVRAQRPALVLLANRVAHPDLAWHALVLSWDTSPSSQEPVVAHTDVPLSSFHAHALVHSGDSQAFLAQIKALLHPPAEDMRLMRTV